MPEASVRRRGMGNPELTPQEVGLGEGIAGSAVSTPWSAHGVCGLRLPKTGPLPYVR